MITLGYLLALSSGVALGLLGGGGSMLAVPILVYVFGVSVLDATSYSLAIVGITALIGSIQHMWLRTIAFPAIVWFGIPDAVMLFTTRAFLLPILPEQIGFSLLSVSKEAFIMLVFGTVMLLVAYKMIAGKKQTNSSSTPKPALAVMSGIGTGLLTGIIGAGGGFLIVPALVLLLDIPIRKAIGTSLFIIAAKSLIGFTASVATIEIDWQLLTTFAMCSVAGVFLGGYVAKYISTEQLKKSFGWFMTIMALLIIATQLR